MGFISAKGKRGTFWCQGTYTFACLLCYKRYHTVCNVHDYTGYFCQYFTTHTTMKKLFDHNAYLLKIDCNIQWTLLTANKYNVVITSFVHNIPMRYQIADNWDIFYVINDVYARWKGLVNGFGRGGLVRFAQQQQIEQHPPIQVFYDNPRSVRTI